MWGWLDKEYDSMSRSIVNMATDKPKSARSLMWYVDCLIVIGVLGVVAALVLINFVLVWEGQFHTGG